MLTPDNYWKFVDEICADPKGQLVVDVDGVEVDYIQTIDFREKKLTKLIKNEKGQLVVNVDGDELEIETVEFKTIKIKIGDTFELTLT